MAEPRGIRLWHPTKQSLPILILLVALLAACGGVADAPIKNDCDGEFGSAGFEEHPVRPRLQLALQHRTALPRHLLDRGESVAGDASRLRAALMRALKGEPNLSCNKCTTPAMWRVEPRARCRTGERLKVGLLGGSISTWGASRQELLWSRIVHRWAAGVAGLPTIQAGTAPGSTAC
jgi:hypothetical protein